MYDRTYARKIMDSKERSLSRDVQNHQHKHKGAQNTPYTYYYTFDCSHTMVNHTIYTM